MIVRTSDMIQIFASRADNIRNIDIDNKSRTKIVLSPLMSLYYQVIVSTSQQFKLKGL